MKKKEEGTLVFIACVSTHEKEAKAKNGEEQEETTEEESKRKIIRKRRSKEGSSLEFLDLVNKKKNTREILSLNCQ